MKKCILTFLLLFSCSFGADFLNSDYAFIDSAFDGIKPVTDKQFNDTINKLTPKPVENTFKGKIKAFLFGREYGVETPHQEDISDFDFGGEKKAIVDIKNGVYYIRLTAAIVACDNKIIPVGNYKIQQKLIDEKPMLIFYQGRDMYGMLPLKSFEDNLKKEHDIAYSRIDVVSDYIIRIVYATFDDTKCALAKVYNPY